VAHPQRASATLRSAALAALLAATGPGAARAQAPPAARPPAAVRVAPDVDVIRGRFVPNTQPDGNSVLFRGPQGLVLVDTGRHPEHTQAVLDFAKAARVPIVAVVNTHWHLDHVGGNPLVRSAYPALRVYASGAIDEALTGFLADYRRQLQSMIDKTPDAEAQRPFRSEIALIDAGPKLAPDVKVAATRDETLGGRKLRIGFVPRAATAGDLFVFDPRTRVLAAGDLVTLPAPFLDTACPSGWHKALGELAAVDFQTLVPGHGAPMSRQDFVAYRSAFEGLLACAASDKQSDECIDGWTTLAAPLLKDDDPKFVRALLGYYVELLRKDGARLAGLCKG
jgi:glyoxylase-like metal-dependent hydrolase (beta-lactamase superfamily II)